MFPIPVAEAWGQEDDGAVRCSYQGLVRILSAATERWKDGNHLDRLALVIAFSSSPGVDRNLSAGSDTQPELTHTVVRDLDMFP